MAEIRQVEIQKQVLQKKAVENPKTPPKETKLFGQLTTSAKIGDGAPKAATTPESLKAKSNISAFSKLTLGSNTSATNTSASVFANRLNSAQSSRTMSFGLADDPSTKDRSELTEMEAYERDIAEMRENNIKYGTPAFGLMAPQENTTPSVKEAEAIKEMTEATQKASINPNAEGASVFGAGYTDSADNGMDSFSFSAFKKAGQNAEISSNGWKPVKPGQGTQKPGHGADKPGHGGHEPQRPGHGADKPGHGGHGPQRPGHGGHGHHRTMHDYAWEVTTGHTKNPLTNDIVHSTNPVLQPSRGCGRQRDYVLNASDATRKFNSGLQYGGGCGGGGCGSYADTVCGGGDKMKWYDPIVYGAANGIGAGLSIGLTSALGGGIPMLTYNAINGTTGGMMLGGGGIMIPTAGTIMPCSTGTSGVIIGGVGNGLQNIVMAAGTRMQNSGNIGSENMSSQNISSAAADNMKSVAGNIKTDEKYVTAEMVNDGNKALKAGSAELNTQSANLADARGREAGYKDTLENNKKYRDDQIKEHGTAEQAEKVKQDDVTKTETALDEAQQAYDNAKTAQSEAATKVEETSLARDNASKKVTTDENALNQATQNVTGKQTIVDNLKSANPQDPTAIAKAKADLTTAKAQADKAKATLEASKKALEEANTKYEEAKNQKAEADKAFEKNDDNKNNVEEELNAAREAHDAAVEQLAEHKARMDEAENWFFESEDKLKQAQADLNNCQGIFDKTQAAHNALDKKVTDAYNSLNQKFAKGEEAVRGQIGDFDGTFGVPSMPEQQSPMYNDFKNYIQEHNPADPIDNSYNNQFTQQELDEFKKANPQASEEIDKLTPRKSTSAKTPSSGSYTGGSAQGAIDNYNNTIGALNTRPQSNSTRTASPAQTPEAHGNTDSTKKINLTILVK